MDDKGWGYLALGTVGVKRGTRELWIVPWRKWLAMEDMIREYQASIPHTAGKGISKTLQEKGLDITRIFRPYQAYWEKGCWHVQSVSILWHLTPEQSERVI